MSKLSTLTSRGRFLGAASALLLTTVVSALAPTFAGAEQITVRSLQLSSSASGAVPGDAVPGSATNGQRASYTFSYTAQSATSMQSWSTMFCTTAFGYLNTTGSADRPVATGTSGTAGDANPCPTPTGFTALAWNGSVTPVVTVNGAAAGGTWTATVNATRPNVLLISSSAAAPVAVGDQVVVGFPATATNYITNPTTDTYTSPGGFQNTFFGHVTSYADTAWATKIDDGTVTSAITESVAITAKVQETLKFSVGTDPAGLTTACEALGQANSATSPVLTLGDTVNGALSSIATYDATSYVRLSTNSANGTVIQYAGNTLKSGSNTIDPLTVSAAPAVGDEQFGLGIDTANGATNAVQLNTIATGYDAATGYQFQDTENNTDFPTTYHKPQALISSAGFVECDTAAVKYIANVDPNTEAGVYRTSINYIAVPKY